MVKSKENLKTKNLIFYSALALFLLVLCYLFPYTGDDWAWGASLGIERLSNGFKDYNGRYLGNLLVLLITRSRVLRAVVMAGTVTAIIRFAAKTVGKNSFSVAALLTVGFFAVPRLVFRQAVVWTSGFSNYVVPTALVIIYFCIASDIFRGVVKKTAALPVITAVLGLSTALFMENITLYQIGLDVLLIIYMAVKYKKTVGFVISHLVASIVGAAVMFTNGAYLKIANGDDGYRTMNGASNGVFSQIKTNLFSTIGNELVCNNVVFNLILLFFSVCLVYHFFKKNRNVEPLKKYLILGCVSFEAFFFVYPLLAAIFPAWKIFLGYTKYFNALGTIVVCLALLVLSFLCITKKSVRDRVCFEIISIGGLTAPLLVVTPIGSRCFFCSYVFFMLVAAEYFFYVFKDADITLEKVFEKSFIVLSVCFAIYYISIFGYIYKADTDRIDYVYEQVESGKSEINLPALPYADYLWTSTPTDNTTIWAWRFKDFYKIDQETKLNIISYDEWRTLEKAKKK